MWEAGDYSPYLEEDAVPLLSKMKAMVPEYVRIQRIQRDIPVTEISAGIHKSNIRQLVGDYMQKNGMECRCIRCREVGHRGTVLSDSDRVVLKDTVYEASGGTEHFIALEYDDSLIGYVRLRLDSNPVATIRELKVFGKVASIGDEGEDWQHRGYGRKLVSEAERIATEAGRKGIRVTSGVGVRGYYRSLGFTEGLPYMVKDL